MGFEKIILLLKFKNILNVSKNKDNTSNYIPVVGSSYIRQNVRLPKMAKRRS